MNRYSIYKTDQLIRSEYVDTFSLNHDDTDSREQQFRALPRDMREKKVDSKGKTTTHDTSSK